MAFIPLPLVVISSVIPSVSLAKVIAALSASSPFLSLYKVYTATIVLYAADIFRNDTIV
ncbi:hypothetical protein [Mucilaginibacter segetis]|uniref:Uncharacterized protein n=1 Tax=Mucilaginibacter segetis TaxID=2793071 RepID=A0A934PSN7_9SPHI|nr:hypothetical protein [Mucilaginibacter segetis]MBK0378476.1 hypothetical protein [Mucilaginibacter segetis]